MCLLIINKIISFYFAYFNEPLTLIAEAVAIAVLAGAAYLMSLKDKLSLEKQKLREDLEE